MAMGTTPLPQRRLRAAEPLPGCPAFDHPVPPTRCCPVVGQSEQVECAVPRVGPLVGSRLPERDQRRLRRMDGSAVAGNPLRQHGHDPPGVRFPLAADAKVIGKAEQDAATLQPWPYLALAPLIQDMREE